MSDEINDRVTELETQLAFQDDLVQSLNQIVTEQKKQIEQLANELRSLREEVSGLTYDKTKTINERPPHY